MGNAWIDPANQYPAYIDYAYATGLIKKDSPEAERAEAVNERCLNELQNGGKDKVLLGTCEGLLGVVFPPAKK